MHIRAEKSIEMGGEPEAIGCKANIGARTSEAGAKPDLARTWLELGYLAKRRHSDILIYLRLPRAAEFFRWS